MRELRYDPRWRGLILAAPAGWGKSRLLETFEANAASARVRFPIRGDDDPGLADRFRAALESATGAAMVLDDLHLAGARLDPLIREALEDRGVRILAATRTEPAPLWSVLAARGEAACLGPFDLALSSGEVNETFQEVSGHPVPAAWRELLAEAAGWPIAVRALAQALARALERDATVPDPPWNLLLDLVAGAIWDDLDAPARDALRMAALLGRPRLQVLEQIGAGRRDLQELGRRYCVLPGKLAGEIRLAPGVAALVREREAAPPETRGGWHLAAAAAYERSEDWEAAIAHLLAHAGPGGQRHEAPGRPTPAAWLDALDPERQSAEPLARLWHGRLEAQSGRAGEAEKAFRAAREAFEARGDGAGVYACLVSVATAALARGDRPSFEATVLEAAGWEEAGLPEDQVTLLVAQGATGSEAPGPGAAGEFARVAAALPPLGFREAGLTRRLLERTGSPATAPRPQAGVAARIAGLKVQALGPLRVFLPDGRELQWPRRKAKILLAYLLVSPKGADRLMLAESLSGGAVGSGAEHALRVVVHALRKSLESGADGAQARYVVFDQDRYRLLPEAVAESDLADLEALLAGADARRTAGDAEAAAGQYGDAAALYKGDLFDEEVLLPYFEVERAGLRARTVEGLRFAAEFHRSRSDTAAAESLARRMTEIHPTDESSHRLLIEILLAQGRRELARHQVQVFRLICERQLGYAPDADELAELLGHGDL
ncbi:MAG: hypothetical protein FJZ01_06380 [Candidatus Sericytochromatia bacterium]|nr:hypothetical protein [Candidatus Tanganyikabacteria bacterium]